MSKDCKDTLQTLKKVTKRECDAKWEQSICQMRSWAELSTRDQENFEWTVPSSTDV